MAATNVFPLRFGVSARTMTDLNRTDVTAALKVWFETIAKERGIYADPNPRVFDSLADFAEALRREEIDVVTAPSDEFIVLEKTVPLAGLYSTAVGGRITEEYVLLVRQDSPFQSLADLRDGRLIVLTHPSAGLAPNWLDTELLRNKLPVSARFFRGITRTSKMNRAILPVFFNQADSCLATRRGFECDSPAGSQGPACIGVLPAFCARPRFLPGQHLLVGSRPVSPSLTTSGRHTDRKAHSDPVSMRHFCGSVRVRIRRHPRLSGGICQAQGGSGKRDAHSMNPMSCYVGVILLVFSSAVQAADTNGIASESPTKFRLAFSIGVIGEINRNDAKAATLAWGKMILSQRNIVAETVPAVFDRPDDLFHALQNEEIDAAAVLANEFLTHPASVPPDGVFLTARNGKSTNNMSSLCARTAASRTWPNSRGAALNCTRVRQPASRWRGSTSSWPARNLVCRRACSARSPATKRCRG